MARFIDIQGHRGARALFPENTLRGFVAAAALGVTAFELDVGMTADGVPVVVHDPVLNPDIARDPAGRWVDSTGPAVFSLTLAQLQAYDVGRLRPGSRTAALFPRQVPFDGERIPTLAAVLEALPEARFTIEIKTDPAQTGLTATPVALARATLAVIDEARAAGRVIVEAFDWRVQQYIRRDRADIRLAWLTRPETIANARLWWDGLEPVPSVPGVVAAQGGPVWTPDFTTLTREDVAEAQALGLIVLPWTVNQPEDMDRLIGWGVDGLISDRPDIALRRASASQTV